MEWTKEQNENQKETKYVSIESRMSTILLIIEEAKKRGIDLIFKGNILLHIIQYLRDYDTNIRGTKDIDVNFVGDNVNSFIEILEKTRLNDIKSNKIVPNGYKIVFWGNDLDIKHVDLKIYEGDLDEELEIEEYEVNGTKIVGQTIEKIVYDKITTASKNIIRRRSKDIFDLYILLDMGFDEEKLTRIILRRASQLQIGDFDAFKDKKLFIEILKKLRIQKTNADWESVYDTVYDFFDRNDWFKYGQR